jgi:ComF family protein
MVLTANNLLTTIKESIFPLFCLNCNQEGFWVCPDCLKQIETNGIFCYPNCAKNFALDFHLAIAKYEEDELIGQIIQTFKYQFAEEILTVIRTLINKFLAEQKEKFGQIDWIVPVPLHRKRLAERGFNQAELIGKIVADLFAIPMVKALKRHRATLQQAKLARLERIENVKNAFILDPNINVTNKNILLIDDVFTTGSTMQECARALKQSGAKVVASFTLARG